MGTSTTLSNVEIVKKEGNALYAQGTWETGKKLAEQKDPAVVVINDSKIESKWTNNGANAYAVRCFDNLKLTVADTDIKGAGGALSLDCAYADLKETKLIPGTNTSEHALWALSSIVTYDESCEVGTDVRYITGEHGYAWTVVNGIKYGKEANTVVE